jgi:hypothetical protein
MNLDLSGELKHNELQVLTLLALPVQKYEYILADAVDEPGPVRGALAQRASRTDFTRFTSTKSTNIVQNEPRPLWGAPAQPHSAHFTCFISTKVLVQKCKYWRRRRSAGRLCALPSSTHTLLALLVQKYKYWRRRRSAVCLALKHAYCTCFKMQTPRPLWGAPAQPTPRTLLALLVQKYKCWHLDLSGELQRNELHVRALLVLPAQKYQYWHVRSSVPGTAPQFTCVTSTKVQILTREARCSSRSSPCARTRPSRAASVFVLMYQ